MNLRSYLGSLFTKANLNGELDQIRESARADAQLVVSTYVQEFEREAGMILLDHSHQFGEAETGNEYPDPLDYDEQLPELGTLTRSQLMGRARDRGMVYTRTITKIKLIEMLEKS